MTLVVLGGLGFLMLSEGFEFFSRMIRRRRKNLSLHSKLVWIMTLSLIVLPFLSFLMIEWSHSLQGFSLKEKILASLFQVITPRTAGFNTMELNFLNPAAVFLLISLMFIGASPGSTGGGVKTSTIGVIFAFIKSRIAARESINLFYRSLPFELVTKAFTVVVLSICVIFVSSAVLFLTQSGMSMEETFFEVFSAFGTVGLSLGLTAKLNAVGKIVIVLTMFIGRIGPLTLLYAFSREKAFGKFEYVEESVMIG
jgi:trk system potassium uptake protein TrkH